MAIPKVIHYCWLGGKPKPESVLKCIASWRKYCPDYEIKEWNESNLDISMNAYTRQAYDAKAWGFVPDYLRLWIVYTYGGIYLDTDVQMVRSFDPLLKESGFAGFEDQEHISLGLGFGAEAGNKLLEKHMRIYDDLRFVNEDGSLNRTPSPTFTTAIMRDEGFHANDGTVQRVNGFACYPPEYFCPRSFATGILKLTRNTFSIHQFDASWYSDEEQIQKQKYWKDAKKDYWIHLPNRIVRKILGDAGTEKLKGILKKKRDMKANILPLSATVIGLACVAGVLIGDVISAGAAAVWSLLWIISCLCLLHPKFERVIYPCLIVLMAFTAECVMQLQIQHAFELSLAYQRIIDFCLYCVFFAFFGAVTKRKSTGLIVGNVFFFIIASLNLALTVFRGKPVYFPDIYSAKTALDFVNEYSFPLSKVHLVCAISVLSCVLCCLVFRRKMTDMNERIAKRVQNAVCIMLIPVLSVLLHIPTVFHFRGYYFSTTEYWLYSFCMSAYQMNIEEPKTYDSNTVPIKETSDRATFDTQMPNVLFIMNESFADLRVISSFEEGDSAMPFFDSLSQRDDVARGNLYVSIYGGNTANTEFEVLTGISMYHLPYDTTAYNLYVNSETMSLASYFDHLGYRTIAFHPSAKTNYNRNNVYPNLGFQEAYFQEDFSDLDTLRTFTSDVSNYEKVMEFFEKKNIDERLFFFNLTVQNHGPFNFDDDEFENKVSVANTAFSSTQQFLSCLKYSDEALEMLLEYLDTYPEPVAVVFFGDHQAKIDDAFYEMLYGKNLSALSGEEKEKQYVVPYMIWTNYQLALEDNVNMSANYLGVYVIEQLGLPQTGYQKFLNSLRQEYPVITAQSIGTAMSTEGFSDNPRLEAYENCCYNLLFDKDSLWTSIYTNPVCDSAQ